MMADDGIYYCITLCFDWMAKNFKEGLYVYE